MSIGVLSVVGGLGWAPVALTLPAGCAATWRFRIVDCNGEAVRDFEPEQTKKLHLIVVRTDLTGYEHLHPALGGFARELRHQVRRPMRRDDPMLVRHAEPIEQRHAMLHRFPIRGAPHHHTDESWSGHFLRHKARSPSLLPKRKNCNALFGAAIIPGEAEESPT